MSTLHLPGFTAESSLYATDGRFHPGVSTSRALNADVLPQGLLSAGSDNPLSWGDFFINVPPLPRFPFDPHPMARCRAACLHRGLRGAALRACLAEC